MIGNTDDHLKNFSMLHNDAGWKLTPAYDLLPDIENRSEHVLDFGYTGPILCICDYKTAVKLIINWLNRMNKYNEEFNAIYDSTSL